MIRKNYIAGWFTIDFFAIFPFQVFFSQGFALKLVRLMRLPRLVKLLSEGRFRKILQERLGVNPGIQDLSEIYSSIFIFKITRLILGLIFMSFFSACVFYIVSTLFDSEFIEENGIQLINDPSKLITVSYFALTTLSTVGYGDLAPLSVPEMIITIIIQMGGVAVFSFSMGMLTQMIESTSTGYNR